MIELKRLRWRCRRGLLELDIIFTRFLDQYEGALTAQDVAALDSLLNYPDNELWQMITSNWCGNDEHINRTMDRLRNC